MLASGTWPACGFRGDHGAMRRCRSKILWLEAALEQLFMDTVIVLHQGGSDLYDLLWKRSLFLNYPN